MRIFDGALPLLVGALAAGGCAQALTAVPPASSGRIDDREAVEIARRIFQNEAGGRPEFLTHWNAGEEFASVGIAHFLWYPKGYAGPYVESFPKLLTFLRDNGAILPAWLEPDTPCPWSTRDEFLAAKQSPRMTELRKFLLDTMPLQARFAARRLEESLPKMLAGLPFAEREHVRAEFDRMARSPMGLYPLMDYVNFKGEGTSPTERYKGEGWGLLQVLQAMSGLDPGPEALKEFARSAKAVLARRVANSPPERGEARWTPVWERRIDTYVAAQ
ncbi:MAG TPA: hypothetical protein VNI01_16300 [Elusimicrobiota bacterium]|nr:hypothetical protein [Elusimicrobiota bacterium]